MYWLELLLVSFADTICGSPIHNMLSAAVRFSCRLSHMDAVPFEFRKEMSSYNLELANVERVQKRFDLYDAEARALLEQGLAIPA